MKIEDVEKLHERYLATNGDDNAITIQQLDDIVEEAIAALRAEAWHPIDKAEELGAKDSREVRIWLKGGSLLLASFMNGMWEAQDGTMFNEGCISRFAFNNPPEGA